MGNKTVKEELTPNKPRHNTMTIDLACIASTQHWESHQNDVHVGFRRARWSQDGTCLLTLNADKSLRTFILPTDLLTTSSHHNLEPYSTIPNAESVFDFSVYPGFVLSESNTTLVVSCAVDHPIKLNNALWPEILATYPLINPTTEQYICPHSLQFTPDGLSFVAGSLSRLSLFDINRVGEHPKESFPTIPSVRKKIVGGGVGMKGIVSALDISCDGILAAGTFSRWVGLYNIRSLSSREATYFSVANAEGDIGGQGVSQTLWSPCGRYLYIVERASDGAILYDIRNTQRQLSYLRGRKAMKNVRMILDLVTTDTGHEIWAGDTDGCVRTWHSPHLLEGPCDADLGWQAHSNPVSTVLVHHSAEVVSTYCDFDNHFNAKQKAVSKPRGNSVSERPFNASGPKIAEAQNPAADCFLKVWSTSGRDGENGDVRIEETQNSA